MNPHFHDTIDLNPSRLAEAEGKAIKLEEQIFQFFVSRPNQKFTPLEVNDFFPTMLITSIRRALSNLVRDKKLKDTRWTKEMKEERYGKPNYLWYYEVKVNENGQIEML